MRVEDVHAGRLEQVPALHTLEELGLDRAGQHFTAQTRRPEEKTVPGDTDNSRSPGVDAYGLNGNLPCTYLRQALHHFRIGGIDVPIVLSPHAYSREGEGMHGLRSQ